jgi:hypothetical protein
MRLSVDLIGKLSLGLLSSHEIPIVLQHRHDLLPLKYHHD